MDVGGGVGVQPLGPKLRLAVVAIGANKVDGEAAGREVAREVEELVEVSLCWEGDYHHHYNRCFASIAGRSIPREGGIVCVFVIFFCIETAFIYLSHIPKEKKSLLQTISTHGHTRKSSWSTPFSQSLHLSLRSRPRKFPSSIPFGQSLHLDRISSAWVDPENFLYPSLMSTLAKENITPTHLTTMTSFFKKKKKQEEETQTTTCSSRAPICSFLFMSPKRIPYIQKPTSAPACSSSDRLLQSISQVSFFPLCLYS